MLAGCGIPDPRAVRKELENRGAGIREARIDRWQVRLRRGIRRMHLLSMGLGRRPISNFLCSPVGGGLIYTDEIRNFVEEEWMQAN
jgi:hypothetical protein